MLEVHVLTRRGGSSPLRRTNFFHDFFGFLRNIASSFFTDMDADREDSNLNRKLSVATFVLVRSAHPIRTPLGGVKLIDSDQERAERFESPSDAVIAASKYLRDNPPQTRAAVLTGEFANIDDSGIIDRLRQLADAAVDGQIVVSLATLELVRSTLSSEFIFDRAGTIQFSDDSTEQICLVRSHVAADRSQNHREFPFLRQTALFIGREAEMDNLERLIFTCRTISLYGLTGIGKSALLRKVLERIEGRFPGRIYSLDLSGLSDPDLVTPTLFRLIEGQRLPGEKYDDALVAHLRGQRCLIVLDNADRVIAEVRKLASWILESCPEATVLVGSQRPAKMIGEARLRIEGLFVPEDSDDAASVSGAESVALFVNRARLVDPTFKLNDSNVAVVVSICRKLDGIPLAIELAASKVGIFSPKQIEGLLQDRFKLLDDLGSTRPSRHQTLASTIDWAVQCLSEGAKKLLRRLSVFKGSFDLVALEEVCSGQYEEPGFLIGYFEELVESCLVSPNVNLDGNKYFYLGETVRYYANDQLRRSKESSPTIRRLRQWTLQLIDAASTGLMSQEQNKWLSRLDLHFPDIRDLFEFDCQKRGNPGRAINSLLKIVQYFLQRNYHVAGLSICGLILDHAGQTHCHEKARIHNLAGIFSIRLGDLDGARTEVMSGIAIARARNDLEGIARGSNALIAIYDEKERYDGAIRVGERAIRIFRSLDRSLPTAHCLINVSIIYARTGNAVKAKECLREAEEVVIGLNVPSMNAVLNLNWAHTYLAANEPLQSLRHTYESLLSLNGTSNLLDLSTCYRNAAHALSHLELPGRAATFLGAYHGTVPNLERRIQLSDDRAVKQLREALMQDLSPQKFDEYFSRGYNVDLSDLLGDISTVIT
jgi:predicted ATPase